MFNVLHIILRRILCLRQCTTLHCTLIRPETPVEIGLERIMATQASERPILYKEGDDSASMIEQRVSSFLDFLRSALMDLSAERRAACLRYQDLQWSDQEIAVRAKMPKDGATGASRMLFHCRAGSKALVKCHSIGGLDATFESSC